MTPRTVFIARAAAVGLDALQWGLFPLFAPGFASPLNIGVDFLAFLFFWWLLGFHWAILPTFVVEQLPIVDLAPTWTLAVLFVTRQSNRQFPKAGSPRRE